MAFPCILRSELYSEKWATEQKVKFPERDLFWHGYTITWPCGQGQQWPDLRGRNPLITVAWGLLTTACQHGLWKGLPELDLRASGEMGQGHSSTSDERAVLCLYIPAPGPFQHPRWTSSLLAFTHAPGYFLFCRLILVQGGGMWTSLPMSDSHLLPLSGSQ